MTKVRAFTEAKRNRPVQCCVHYKSPQFSMHALLHVVHKQSIAIVANMHRDEAPTCASNSIQPDFQERNHKKFQNCADFCESSK